MTPQSTNLTLQDAGATVALRAIEVIATGVAVESATPSCISTDGGALITIRGNGFGPGAVVTFGAADGTGVEVRDAHTIVARAPSSSGVSDATITVINPSGDSGTLTGGFAYRFPDSACGPPRHRPSRH